MQGKWGWKLSLLLGVWLQASTAFSSNRLPISTVQDGQFATYKLDNQYKITGASAYQAFNKKSFDYFAIVQNSPIIYRFSPKNGVSSLQPFKDISKIKDGLYTAFTKQNDVNYDFQGLAVCRDEKASELGFVFYVIDGTSGYILRIQGEKIERINVKYKLKNGFTGVTADCAGNKLFVSNQKAPNVVFTINIKDLSNVQVESVHDLSTGEQITDDISDLYYANNQVYILQKNHSSILVMDPKLPGQNARLFLYDYSVTNPITKINDDFGSAEGLVVDGSSIYLFLKGKREFVQLKNLSPAK